MVRFEHLYQDPDGIQVSILESADEPAAAFLNSLGVGARVPAHRLAEFCGSVYAAAGQPVPDLPVIHDPAAVTALARDLLYAIEGTSGGPGCARYEPQARTLLACGWRKP